MCSPLSPIAPHFLRWQSKRSRIVEFTSISLIAPRPPFPEFPPLFRGPSVPPTVFSLPFPLKSRRNHSLCDFLLHYSPSLSSCSGAAGALRCITRLHFLNRFSVGGGGWGGQSQSPLPPSSFLLSLPPVRPFLSSQSDPSSKSLSATYNTAADDRICVALTAVDSSFFSPVDPPTTLRLSVYSVVRSPLTF